MRILLCGASGFIGGHLLTALRAAGHDVRCLARTPKQATHPGFLHGDFATDTTPEIWAPRLDSPGSEIDAVINAVGIIRETRTARFEPLHARAPIALFEAAAARNLRIIQISALGTAPDRPEPYFRWRALADHRLLELSHIPLALTQ